MFDCCKDNMVSKCYSRLYLCFRRLAVEWKGDRFATVDNWWNCTALSWSAHWHHLHVGQKPNSSSFISIFIWFVSSNCQFRICCCFIMQHESICILACILLRVLFINFTLTFWFSYYYLLFITSYTCITCIEKGISIKILTLGCVKWR